jgi:apolipoprotein N-acyltransferase
VSQPIRQALLAAIVSAVLQVLIFPSFSIAWLSWVALAPLIYILALRELKSKNAFLTGYLCGVLWYAGTCFWIYHTMHLYGGLPKPVAVGIVVLFSLYLAIYHAIFGWLVAWVAERQSTKVALAISPFLWVAVELARYHITGFPWDLLGNAVVNNLGITPLARYTGVYGLSFLVALANALFAWAMYRRRAFDFLVAIIFSAAMHLAGLYHPPQHTPQRSALLVQQNVPISPPGTWTADHFDRVMFELANMSRISLQQKGEPRLIVWPESPSPFYVTDVKFRSWISSLATDQKAYVIAGSLGGGKQQDEIYNSAVLVTPDGRFAARYDKIHLVPFGEYVPFKDLFFFAEKLTREVGAFSRGNERNVMPIGEGRAGVFICYESIFPDEVRQFAKNGATLFVNISNDGWYGPYGAPGQHLNMARMRAIENNRWVLRATNTGITASIDPRGRIVAQAPRDARVTLEAPYDFISATTFYTRHGDWFAYACAIIALLSVLAPRRRANQ